MAVRLMFAMTWSGMKMYTIWLKMRDRACALPARPLLLMLQNRLLTACSASSRTTLYQNIACIEVSTDDTIYYHVNCPENCFSLSHGFESIDDPLDVETISVINPSLSVIAPGGIPLPISGSCLSVAFRIFLRDR